MERYIEEFAKYGFELNKEQIDRFSRYLSELMDWNNNINLTAFRTREDMVRKNFLDSLSCLKSGLDFSGKKIIDIGTGAGFPGMPLKIFTEDFELHLLEATGKKVKFLQHIVSLMELDNIYIYHGRSEDFARKPDFREQFDIVLARGVAFLPELIECVLPFIKVGGIFISQKGEKHKEELSVSSKALELTGGKLLEVKPLNMPEIGDKKVLIIIEKIRKTPEKYPGKSGIPSKKPLGVVK